MRLYRKWDRIDYRNQMKRNQNCKVNHQSSLNSCVVIHKIQKVMRLALLAIKMHPSKGRGHTVNHQPKLL